MRSKAKCHPDRYLVGREMCQPCYDKDWAKRNKEKIAGYELKRKTHPKFKERQRRNRETSRLWYQRNKERVAVYHLKRKNDPGYKEKATERGRLWKKRNPKKVVASNYRLKLKRRSSSEIREKAARRYIRRKLEKLQLTEYSYDEMKKKGCEMCGSFEKLCLDHDHETGKFRGLLCRNCNTGIGLLGDSEKGVERALGYFKRIRRIKEDGQETKKGL